MLPKGLELGHRPMGVVVALVGSTIHDRGTAAQPFAEPVAGQRSRGFAPGARASGAGFAAPAHGLIVAMSQPFGGSKKRRIGARHGT